MLLAADHRAQDLHDPLADAARLQPLTPVAALGVSGATLFAAAFNTRARCCRRPRAVLGEQRGWPDGSS